VISSDSNMTRTRTRHREEEEHLTGAGRHAGVKWLDHDATGRPVDLSYMKCPDLLVLCFQLALQALQYVLLHS
jgi:hypothetical protein